MNTLPVAELVYVAGSCSGVSGRNRLTIFRGISHIASSSLARQIFILLLIPCLCLGMNVPSSGDCGRAQRQPMETGESYPPCVCSTHTSPHYGGAFAVEAQGLDPYWFSQLEQEDIWKVVVMILVVAVICGRANGDI